MSDLRCLGGLLILCDPNSFLWCLVTADSLRFGIQSDKFFQLNLVDLHIIGATSSSSAVHFVDVFPWTVGATCMSAASPVSRVEDNFGIA